MAGLGLKRIKLRSDRQEGRKKELDRQEGKENFKIKYSVAQF